MAQGREGRRSARCDPQAGFSLIEMLAALFIMGLAATFVVLNWPDSEPVAEREAEALAAISRLAVQESIVSGSTVGLLITEDGVQIYKSGRGEWLPFILAGGVQRSWDREVTVLMVEPEQEREFDARRRTIGASFDRTDQDETLVRPHPQIYFDATGAATPFDIVISGFEATYRVVGSLDGSIMVVRDDDARPR